MKLAYDQTTNHSAEEGRARQVLLFRDPYGNFSFMPTLNNAFLLPKPHGEEQAELLQRHGTARQLSGRKRRAEQAAENMQPSHRLAVADGTRPLMSSIFIDPRILERQLRVARAPTQTENSGTLSEVPQPLGNVFQPPLIL